jgi:hypothetical protein
MTPVEVGIGRVAEAGWDRSGIQVAPAAPPGSDLPPMYHGRGSAIITEPFVTGPHRSRVARALAPGQERRDRSVHE